MRARSCGIVAALLFVAGPAASRAQEQPPPAAEPQPEERKPDEDAQKDEVRLSLLPYLFIPGRIQGRAGVGGLDTDLNTTFKNVWDAADVGGFAMRAELWSGRMGGVLDGYYSRIEVDEARVTDVGGAQAINLRAEMEFRLGIVDLLAAAAPLDLELGDLVALRLELLCGARIVDFKQEARTTIGAQSVELGDSHNWVELAFGLRTKLKVWWFYALVGTDISGFGIGSGSDYIFNLLLGVGFQPADVFSLELGYRVLDMDYDRGSGSDEIFFDVTQQGPQLTIGLHF